MVRHSVAGGLEVATGLGGRGLQLADGVCDAVMSGFTEAMGATSAILAPAVLACPTFAPTPTRRTGVEAPRAPQGDAPPTADRARTDCHRSPGAVSTSGRDEGEAGSGRSEGRYRRSAPPRPVSSALRR